MLLFCYDTYDIQCASFLRCHRKSVDSSKRQSVDHSGLNASKSLEDLSCTRIRPHASWEGQWSPGYKRQNSCASTVRRMAQIGRENESTVCRLGGTTKMRGSGVPHHSISSREPVALGLLEFSPHIRDCGKKHTALCIFGVVRSCLWRRRDEIGARIIRPNQPHCCMLNSENPR